MIIAIMPKIHTSLFVRLLLPHILKINIAMKLKGGPGSTGKKEPIIPKINNNIVIIIINISINNNRMIQTNILKLFIFMFV